MRLLKITLVEFDDYNACCIELSSLQTDEIHQYNLDVVSIYMCIAEIMIFTVYVRKTVGFSP